MVLRVGVLACVIGFLFAGLAPGHLATRSASAATIPVRPVVLSLTSSPSTAQVLPADGAHLIVSVRVRDAISCSFFRQHAPFSALYLVRTVRCAAGRASVTMPPIANPYRRPVKLTYAVRVHGKGPQSVDRRLTVRETAATPPPPPIPPPTAAPPTARLIVNATILPASGGTVIATFSSSKAAACTLAASPNLWTGNNPASVRCNGTDPITVPVNSGGQRQWTLTFTATSSGGNSASAAQSLSQAASPIQQSPTWSGYVVPSTSLVTSVSGQWAVPTANCAPTPDAGASIWVGIGGWSWPTGGNSGTLLQTGVQLNCVAGVAQYVGWFEEYPSSPNSERAFAGFPVSTGDQIAASVFQTPSGAWETRLDDLTTGLSGVMVTGEGWGVMPDAGDGTFPLQGYTTGLSYGGGYTAEWIVEDYGGPDGSPVLFADYGTVGFSNVRTSLNPWTLAPGDAVEIVQNGVVLSTPSPPFSDGFNLSYSG